MKMLLCTTENHVLIQIKMQECFSDRSKSRVLQTQNLQNALNSRMASSSKQMSYLVAGSEWKGTDCQSLWKSSSCLIIFNKPEVTNEAFNDTIYFCRVVEQLICSMKNKNEYS